MPAPSTETGMYKKAYPSSPAAEGGSERGRGDGGQLKYSVLIEDWSFSGRDKATLFFVPKGGIAKARPSLAKEA